LPQFFPLATADIDHARTGRELSLRAGQRVRPPIECSWTCHVPILRQPLRQTQDRRQ
jgi:hypothetical protein